jgi:hypothetical protein
MEYAIGIAKERRRYFGEPNFQPNSLRLDWKIDCVKMAEMPGLHIQSRLFFLTLPVENIT